MRRRGPSRVQVKLRMQPALLERLDGYWPGLHRSRLAAIEHAVEAMLDAHAAHERRLRGDHAAPAALGEPAHHRGPAVVGPLAAAAEPWQAGDQGSTVGRVHEREAPPDPSELR